MTGLYNFLGIKVDRVVKARDNLIRNIEKECKAMQKEYPESKVPIRDLSDWIMEELMDKFYCEDYE